MARMLFTTGYSGFKRDDFLWKLGLHNVSVVVDVRASATSRNRVFTQSNLRAMLEAEGIKYVHYPSLGVPSVLRRRLRSGESLPVYFKEYRKHLDREQDALDDLQSLVTRRRCCLLCLESKPEECHRSELAKVLAARNGDQIEIEHI